MYHLHHEQSWEIGGYLRHRYWTHESDLPKLTYPYGILHVEIPRLCIGTGKDICLQAVGYLAVYRTERCEGSNTSAEQRNVMFYKQKY